LAGSPTAVPTTPQSMGLAPGTGRGLQIGSWLTGTTAFLTPALAGNSLFGLRVGTRVGDPRGG
jgi:hypothetical protein